MDTVSITLTEGWRFHKGNCDEAWYKGYDDSAWRRVLIPHDWAVESPFSRTNSSGTGYLDGGTGWYRAHFRLPAICSGQRVRVVFDGVYKNSQVWCNSYYLGKRPYGYTEFSYDITHAVSNDGSENVISVKVTHEDLADSRWFTGSGIYRKVRILIEDPVHPALHGIAFTADSVSAESAQIRVRQEIVNDSAADAAVRIFSELTDPYTGETVLVLDGECAVSAGGQAETVLCGTLRHPRLWSVDAPVLYDLKTWYETDGSRSLVSSERVGIRKAVFDPDKGFFLNGVPMKLKGVCVHHDAGPLGAAVTREIWQRRLEILKETGCNAIRCSHNPHMPELYDLCDAMGFLMIDEAFDEWEAPKNKWWQGHNVYPPKHQGYYEDFPEWHDADLRAMVRRDRNHPSVILWSIGNEIDYPNDMYCHPMFAEMTGNNDANKPAAERIYNPDKPNMERIVTIAKELAQTVREEDPSRPVTLAAAFPELSSYIGFLDAVDVIGYNYKEQFYAQDHLRFPDKALLGTENGKHAEAWAVVRDNDYVCGQFLWTGIDFLGEAHGWPVYGSRAGLMKTNGFPKDSFYERSVMWDGPAVKPEFSDAGATDISVTLWQQPDRVTGSSFEKTSSKTGYICQLIVELKDAAGIRTADDHVLRVQAEGSGELLAIDSGDLSDLTPYTENRRRTQDGSMVIYIRRTSPGPICVHLTCIDDEDGAAGNKNTLQGITRSVTIG
jgi:beta-galactosidase/beta-glucuronidase